MNLRIIEIEIENFRSIEKAKIGLANKGTVIVKGINEYEDKASSNGSGKSSIFEAIVFALFEETSAGEKNVSNRITKNGYNLKLKFNIDGDDYVIIRQANGNKSSVLLYKNDEDISARNKTDTNKLILSILGINKDIFLDSVFLSQNANTNIATLSPTARKERLEILTNTDYTINKFKDLLKEKQLLYENQKVTNQLEIEKLKGIQSAITTQKMDVENKIHQLQLELEKLKQLGNIKDIDKQINESEIEIDKLIKLAEQEQLKIQDIDNKIQLNRVESESYIKRSENLNADIVNKKSEIANVEYEIDKIQLENNNSMNLINMYNAEISNIKNSDKCPTCGRKLDGIDDTHIEKTIQEKLNSINTIQQNIESNTARIQEFENQINVKVEEGKTLRQTLNEVEVKVNEYKEIEAKLNSDKNHCIKTIDDIQKNKDNYANNIINLNQKKLELSKLVDNNLDEYNHMLDKLNIDYAQTELKMDLYAKDYEVNNQYVEVVKNSLQLVVKDFRTYLLHNSIEYLNKLLEVYSGELFSNNLDIIKIIEDDTKLDIRLGDATYESLSGGEKTRVNVALLLAQKSLANVLGNISCNIIILDEVLGYCDAEAETNVIQLINTELEVLESIFMISHKEIPIAYDNQLIVVKDATGISSVIER